MISILPARQIPDAFGRVVSQKVSGDELYVITARASMDPATRKETVAYHMYKGNEQRGHYIWKYVDRYTSTQEARENIGKNKRSAIDEGVSCRQIN
jgi:hypothetical protein